MPLWSLPSLLSPQTLTMWHLLDFRHTVHNLTGPGGSDGSRTPLPCTNLVSYACSVDAGVLAVHLSGFNNFSSLWQISTKFNTEVEIPKIIFYTSFKRLDD